jgi:hypothetical protein
MEGSRPVRVYVQNLLNSPARCLRWARWLLVVVFVLEIAKLVALVR